MSKKYVLSLVLLCCFFLFSNISIAANEISCPALLEGKSGQDLVVEDTVRHSSSNATHDLAIQPYSANEFTHIEYGAMQNPPLEVIQLSSGIEFSAVNAKVSLYVVGERMNQVPRTSSAHNQISPQVKLTVSNISDEQVAEHIRSSAQSGLPESVYEVLVNSLLSDPETRSNAVAQFNSMQVNDQTKNKRLEISNTGLERYFKFKPVGKDFLVNARVLNIYKTPDSQIVVVLVEYINGDHNEKDDEKLYPRVIAQLKSKEIRGIKVDPTDREEAKIAFEERRSHNDDKVVRSANKIGLRLKKPVLNSHDNELTDFVIYEEVPFEDAILRQQSTTKENINTTALVIQGENEYADASSRVLRVQGLSSVKIMQDLNSIEHFGIRHKLNLIFGKEKVDALVTQNDLSAYGRFVNIIDVFSRLSPRQILENFFSTELQYSWAIDEDGELRIVLHLPKTNNFNGLSHLRVASGRQIYTGGILTFDTQTREPLYAINSEFYKSQYLSDQEDHEGSDEQVHQFVRNVFWEIAGLKVQSYNPSIHYSFQGDWQNDSRSTNRENDYFKWSGIEHPEAPQSSDYQQELTWDFKNDSSPLSFDQWIAHGNSKMGSLEAQKIKWAQYILGVTEQSSKAIIKGHYRKRSQVWHPDKNHNEKEVSARNIKYIYDARDILKKR